MVKRIYIFLISVLCACLLSACAQTTSNESTWQEQYDLGIRYLSEGNYEEAIIAFTAAIEIDPKQALAYVGRGDAYMGSGEAEENLTAAQADYEKALELDKTLENAYLGLANAYVRQGQTDRALEILRQGLERTENSQRIADKIIELEDTSESYVEPEKALSYNAYGGTEFTQREDFRDMQNLTNEEASLIKKVLDTTISNDMNQLSQLGKQYIDSTGCDSVFIRTILDGYKIEYRSRFSTFHGEMETPIEVRPENGTGYDAYITESVGGHRTLCECAEWQWNGIATYTIIDNGKKYDEETFIMENGLRNGTGSLSSTEKPDGNFWGISSGYPGPLEDQWTLDQLYW